ncbi:MAG: hypothetical protein J6034_04940, partial [Bacteroidaceae bacterium]|nr:hypothetical protein [Bacteroidaceae bacterium]
SAQPDAQTKTHVQKKEGFQKELKRISVESPELIKTGLSTISRGGQTALILKANTTDRKEVWIINSYPTGTYRLTYDTSTSNTEKMLYSYAFCINERHETSSIKILPIE